MGDLWKFFKDHTNKLVRVRVRGMGERTLVIKEVGYDFIAGLSWDYKKEEVSDKSVVIPIRWIVMIE